MDPPFEARLGGHSCKLVAEPTWAEQHQMGTLQPRLEQCLAQDLDAPVRINESVVQDEGLIGPIPVASRRKVGGGSGGVHDGHAVVHDGVARRRSAVDGMPQGHR